MTLPDVAQPTAHCERPDRCPESRLGAETGQSPGPILKDGAVLLAAGAAGVYDI